MRAPHVPFALLGLAFFGCSASDAPPVDAGGDRPDAGRECTLDLQCNDRVECTVDRCDNGRCTYEPTALRCSEGSACDPVRGCLPRRACTTDENCADTDPCTANERCQSTGGYCVYDPLPNDTPCGDGRTCRGGACACPLATPARCGGACVDTGTDPNHCGACGVSCGAGAWCNDGRCACTAPQQWCPRSGCTDITVDGANCGACGNACTAPATCQSGACVQPCPDAQHRCGGACVSFTEVATCGTRCDPCPTPEHGRPTCAGLLVAASCGVTCDAGYHACGTRCLDNNAEASCGDRCSPCPTPERGSVACRGGACVVTCVAGYHPCGGTCAPNDAVTSCGDRCAPCPMPENGVAACVSGSCDFTCRAGFQRCGDICSDGTSPLGCGPSCTRCMVPSNGLATCSAGSCGFRCNAGYHACGLTCGSDASPLSCGARCDPCPAPAHAAPTCTAATCGFVCDPGYMRDGDVCRELPRAVWPPSGSFVTGRRPAFRWTLPPDAPADSVVEVCRDRACATVVATLPAAMRTGSPEADLPAVTLFWRVRAGAVASPVWTLSVTRRPSESAGPVAVWGDNPDFNGDGYADVAVGAPLLARPGPRFYVFRGTASGLTPLGRASFDDPSPARPGTLPSQFAWSLAAGDFNGDGYSDLVAGTPGHDNNIGRAYLYLGGPTGLGATPAQTLEGPAAERSAFGNAVSSAGDLNADGYNDLVVGAPGGDDGHVFVYYGNGRGVATTPSVTLDGPAGLATRLGAALANAGDLDADGDSDLAVGAPEFTFGVGRAFVFRGAPAGLVTASPVPLRDDFGGRIGTAVAGLGDVNGDGYPDLAVTAPAIDNGVGRVHVYHGRPTTVAAPPTATIIGPAGMEGDFGAVVVAAGDTNGDGYADVLASAPRGDMYTGRAYLFRGGATGVATMFTHNFFDTAAGAGALYGGALGGARDIDNDGYSDVVISAERASTFTGQITVLRGGADGLGGPTVITGPEGGGTRFGVSLAWRDQVCRAPRGV